MAEHPIQNLMKTAMESIKGMADVNTIIGDTVESPDGTVIIPISKVTFGFAAGGSGAGVTVKPVGFLICAKENGVRFLPVDKTDGSDRLVDLIPWTLEKVGQFLAPKEGRPLKEEGEVYREDGI